LNGINQFQDFPLVHFFKSGPYQISGQKESHSLFEVFLPNLPVGDQVTKIGSGLSKVGKVLDFHHLFALFVLDNILSEAKSFPFLFVVFQTFHELLSLIQTDLFLLLFFFLIQSFDCIFDSLSLLNHAIEFSKNIKSEIT
jgi:hypothetical protein